MAQRGAVGSFAEGGKRGKSRYALYPLRCYCSRNSVFRGGQILRRSAGGQARHHAGGSVHAGSRARGPDENCVRGKRKHYGAQRVSFAGGSDHLARSEKRQDRTRRLHVYHSLRRTGIRGGGPSAGGARRSQVAQSGDYRGQASGDSRRAVTASVRRAVRLRELMLARRCFGNLRTKQAAERSSNISSG